MGRDGVIPPSCWVRVVNIATREVVPPAVYLLQDPPMQIDEREKTIPRFNEPSPARPRSRHVEALQQSHMSQSQRVGISRSPATGRVAVGAFDDWFDSASIGEINSPGRRPFTPSGTREIPVSPKQMSPNQVRQEKELWNDPNERNTPSLFERNKPLLYTPGRSRRPPSAFGALSSSKTSGTPSQRVQRPVYSAQKRPSSAQATPRRKAGYESPCSIPNHIGSRRFNSRSLLLSQNREIKTPLGLQSMPAFLANGLEPEIVVKPVEKEKITLTVNQSFFRSDRSGVWSKIAHAVSKGEKILFVGIPSGGKSDFVRACEKAYGKADDSIHHLLDVDKIKDLGRSFRPNAAYKYTISEECKTMIGQMNATSSLFYIGWIPDLTSLDFFNGKLVVVRPLGDAKRNASMKFKGDKGRRYHQSFFQDYVAMVEECQESIEQVVVHNNCLGSVEMCPAMIKMVYDVQVSGSGNLTLFESYGLRQYLQKDLRDYLIAGNK